MPPKLSPKDREFESGYEKHKKNKRLDVLTRSVRMFFFFGSNNFMTKNFTLKVDKRMIGFKPPLPTYII
jgi:hypothetical protein